ncbi:protein kinase, partial [Acidobacteria bacterium AH-259-A15]|nr:protein kinase [Acidobacteria bacterium AH-259-A15]
ADGLHFLVLELVEGETLAERVAKGPLPVEEALEICRQIAEGVAAAHEKGVIHRDLKPANVKITPQGTVKVLDFGLAKALEGERPAADMSHSPTLTEEMTRAGVILGTAAYMSPEQARGKPVDKRADVWAFGCVLYQLLSGRQAFQGETVSDMLAAVLKTEPDWQALPADTPPRIRELLHRCLRKEPHKRLHDIANARIEIEERLAEPSGVMALRAAPAASEPVWRRALPWTLVALLAVSAGLMAWRLIQAGSPTPRNPARFSVHLAKTDRLVGRFPAVALSPDGTRMVLTVAPGDKTELYLRRMDRLELACIPGTERAYSPFFSPDGRWVAFTADGKLKKISIEGGSALTLCDAHWGGGSWGSDGTIIYTPSYGRGLWQVSAAGGTPQVLTTPDSTAGELGHWWPQILPSGKAVLFTIYSTPIDQARIAVHSLETGERRILIEGGLFARYVPTGHLVYVRSETIMAVPFDLAHLEVSGAPVPVVEDVAVDPPSGHAQFAFSAEGTLAYIPASVLNAERMLLWVDRTGTEQPVIKTPGLYSDPRLSPDGQRVALSIQQESRDVWVYELARGTLTRLTFRQAAEFGPIWTPDGARVIYQSEQPQYDLYWRRADGSAPEEPLLSSDYDKRPSSISPDGKVLAFTEINPDTGEDIWLLPLEGKSEPKPFLDTPFGEEFAAFSPDGRWLAYQSNESGRDEVYVTAYPDPAGGRWQISTDGGTEPLWARSGKELFYRNGDKLMAVQIDTASGLAGTPTLLFEGPYAHFAFAPGYDLAPDNQRFLMVKTPPESAPRQVNVVLNWFQELKRLVPPDK